MTVAAGVYGGGGLTEALLATLSGSLESETLVKGALVTDSYTPNFNTHLDVADLTNELVDGDYARATLTTTEVTVSGGTLTFDAVDTSYGDPVTLTSAMGHAIHLNTGTDGTSELFALQDFVTAASSSAGSFTVQHNAGGIVTIDFTP